MRLCSLVSAICLISALGTACTPSTISRSLPGRAQDATASSSFAIVQDGIRVPVGPESRIRWTREAPRATLDLQSRSGRIVLRGHRLEVIAPRTDGTSKASNWQQFRLNRWYALEIRRVPATGASSRRRPSYSGDGDCYFDGSGDPVCPDPGGGSGGSCDPAVDPTCPSDGGGDGGGGGGTPPTPAPPPCAITSTTAATTPPNQARTTIGVGEVVFLLSDGNTWSVTGDGTLSSTSTSDTTLTAGATAGQVTVGASGGSSCAANSMTFTVIAPSGTSYIRTGGIRHTQGQDDIGMKADVGILPDSVSFRGVYWLERDAPATASGTYSCNNGQGHSPNPTPIKVGDEVPGRGSDVGVDTIYFPGCPNVNPLGDGSIAISIPDVYSIGSGGAQTMYATIIQSATSSTAGVLSLAKGGATASTNVSSPSSNF